MSLTYRQLQIFINEMNDSQKDCDVAAYLKGQHEYIPVSCMVFTTEQNCDVLDPDHPVFIIDEDGEI